MRDTASDDDYTEYVTARLPALHRLAFLLCGDAHRADDLVAAGARRALADIELALTRIRTGRYGYCRSCNARIPLVVLEAIPKTTLCLGCQQQVCSLATRATWSE